MFNLSLTQQGQDQPALNIQPLVNPYIVSPCESKDLPLIHKKACH